MEKKKDSGLHDVLSGLNKKNEDKTAQETVPENKAETTVPGPEETPEKPETDAPEETASDTHTSSDTQTSEEKIQEQECEHKTVLVEEKKPEKPRRRRTKREIRIAILGVLTSFFVVVGVIASIRFVVDTTKNIVDSTELKEELAYAVFPLVIVDAPEFDSPESLDSSVIISSSIWRLILDADMSTYIKDDVGGITVPDADVEYYVRELYGNNVQIIHQTIPDASVQMSYSADSKSYLIESTPVLLPYTPRVDEVQRSGDTYTIRVSYILPDVTWNLSASHRNEMVEKVMQFTLKKVDGHYQVLSSKLLEVVNNDTSSSSDASTEGLLEDSFESTKAASEFSNETASAAAE